MEVISNMKKKLFVALAVLTMTFALSTTCFAAKSPSGDTLPVEETSAASPSGDTLPAEETSAADDGNGSGNTSSKSPKTGADLAFSFVAVVTAAGVALVSRKKFAEAE